MNTITISESVTLKTANILIDGAVRFDPEEQILYFTEDGWPEQKLSINLDEYGVAPHAGCVFIKDWTEHRGLTESLIREDLVEAVRVLELGNHGQRVYEVRVLVPEMVEV